MVDGGAARPAVFAQHGEGQKGIYLVATSDWKYIYSAGEDREFLFDRVEDPQETRNKAGLRFCAPVLEKLRQHLLAYLKEAGETNAFEEVGGKLAWKEYPRLDEAFLEDPDAGLLFQDEAAGCFGERDGYRGPEVTLDPLA